MFFDFVNPLPPLNPLLAKEGKEGRLHTIIINTTFNFRIFLLTQRDFIETI